MSTKVEEFCKSCAKRGILPGVYYCSWDNHNRFGSKTCSDIGDNSQGNLPPFITSLYQDFQTAQITELLTQFGPIAETWIDIPGALGGANLLLDVPPDNHGLIPDETVAALMRLRKNANI